MKKSEIKLALECLQIVKCMLINKAWQRKDGSWWERDPKTGKVVPYEPKGGKEKEEQDLSNLSEEDKKGLQAWQDDADKAREMGNEKLAQQIEQNIKNKIEELKSEKPKEPSAKTPETGTSSTYDDAGIDTQYHEAVDSLAESEGLDSSNISVSYDTDYGQVIDIDGQEYHIMDETDSYEAGKESVLQTLNDIGIEGVSDWAVNDATDLDKMGRDLAMDSGFEYDNGYENPEIYLDEEPDGADGDWSDEQRDRAGNMAEEEFISQVKSDPMGYIDEMFPEGSEEKKQFMQNYVDLDKLAEIIVDSDGVGNQLATYDGEEIPLKGGKVAYRVN